MELDDNLKRLMKDLGAAINDALSDSEEISEAIQNVRDSGYDVFLVLEATIGFNRRSEGGSDGEEETPEVFEVAQDQGRRSGPAVAHICSATSITSPTSISSTESFLM